MNLGITKLGIMKENFAAMFAGAFRNPFIIFLTSKIKGFAGDDQSVLPVIMPAVPLTVGDTEPQDITLLDPTNFRLQLTII